LFRTRFTCGGMSFSATSRWPQPVSMITGVVAETALTAAATRRPSTCGRPRGNGRGLLRRRGEDEAERAAVAGLAVDLQLRAVPLHHAVDHREAETAAALAL